jgi:hypothetical protein
MIRPSKDGKMLWFIPPDKSHEQEMEFPLVYATTCPKCNNLVQAVFLTNKKIDPRPWEEIFTKVLDGDGKYKRIIPGRHAKHRSRYSVTTLGRGSTISAQMIRYTEHFEKRDDPINTPVCNFVAISSMIPEYRVYDMLLAAFMNPLNYVVKDKDWPEIKERMEKKYSSYDQHAFADAVGPAGAQSGPECIFVSRTAYQWFFQEVTMKYMKPYQPPVPKHW